MNRILIAALALSMTLFCGTLSALAAPGELEPQKETQAAVDSPLPVSSSPDGEQMTPYTEDAKQEDIPATPSINDLDGHWAEHSMRTAEQDGYLLGYPDGTLRPDANITRGEIVSILSRVLHTEPSKIGNANGMATRSDAFLLIDRNFALSAGLKEISFAPYSDAGTLTYEERRAVSSLLSCDALNGYEDGSLRPRGSISRAEFVVLLYRILPHKASESEQAGAGASIYTGSVTLKDADFVAPVYFDGDTTDLDFTNVKADRMVILSQHCDTITFRNTTIKTLIVQGGGTLSLNLTDGSKIESVILTGNQTKLSLMGQISHVEVQGQSNTLHVSSSLDTLLVRGSCNEIAGSGRVKTATIYTQDNQISLAVEKTEFDGDRGIQNASVSLSAPETLPLETLLTVTATLYNPEAKTCQAVWIVNDCIVKEETLTVTPQGTTSQYLACFPYYEGMNTDFSIRFELRYTTQKGEMQVFSSTAQTKLQNYSPEYYAQYRPENVLSRVTTGYQGNYTFAWAQANDYDTKTKEIWVNQKKYSSKTKYLIWINTTYQRVNVFEGSQGKYKLIKSCMVGTGRRGDDTPVGVYTVGTRTASGWTTPEYNVSPVVRFKMGSGLAFHSRIYNPKHTRMTDASIGFPVSHGCIRMYDEDVWWIYHTIPEGTTVVVF